LVLLLLVDECKMWDVKLTRQMNRMIKIISKSGIIVDSEK